MKVMVLGSGGRENALGWKISQSPMVSDVFIAPGNGGSDSIGTRVDVDINDHENIIKTAKDYKIDFTVVGPEFLLCQGIVDAFEKEGLMIFGPNKKASKLEGSKIFAKEVMNAVGVPTAYYEAFDRPHDAIVKADQIKFPIVIKEDGLASGKGVSIVHNKEEYLSILEKLCSSNSKSQQPIMVEEFINGEEVSVLAIVDGKNAIQLESSQDHKRIGNGDTGPNTGGMGAYSPAPIMNDDMKDRINRDVIYPIINYMEDNGSPFKGVLYAGIIINSDGPHVLEFNVRFGDPECQALMLRMKSDIMPVLMESAKGKFDNPEIEWDIRPSVCVVMTSENYPANPIIGMPIEGLDSIAEKENLQVFHAGTKKENDKIIVNGGRVMNVVAMDDSLSGALDLVYGNIENIKYNGAYWRTDIAHRAIKNLP